MVTKFYRVNVIRTYITGTKVDEVIYAAVIFSTEEVIEDNIDKERTEERISEYFYSHYINAEIKSFDELKFIVV